MSKLRGKLSYSNVVATLALFLALGGGAAWAAGNLGKNAVKSKNIAPHAVKSKNLAKNAVKGNNIAKGAVTGAKVKAGSLTSSAFKAGSLSGKQIGTLTTSPISIDETATPAAGTPLALAGLTSITPVAGKTYVLATEMRGNPVDAENGGFNYCFGEVIVSANGAPISFTEVYANNDSPWDIYKIEPVGTGFDPLPTPDTNPVNLTAQFITDGGCKPMTATFRASIIELG